MTSQTLSLNSSCKTTTKSHLSQKIQSLLLNNPLLLQRQKHLQELLQIRHQTINFILDKFPEERLFVEYCLENLRKTVIIVGSPRGGTSAYKSLLSQSNHLISMLGEHRHLFTLWVVYHK